MMLRLPRVVTAPLPEGQDWTIRKVGDKAVIVVNENLKGDEYQAAWRAAYASMRRRHLVWIPLPAAAIGTWLTRKLRTPIGAATLASLATAATVYGIVQLDGADLPRTIAEPRVVVTVHHFPTTLQPTPSPSHGQRTSTALPASPLPEQTSHPPASPPTTTPARTPQPADSTRPPAPDATQQATPPDSPTSGPPGIERTRPPSSAPPESTPTESPRSTPSTTTAPSTNAPAAAGCGGIHLGVPLDPLLNVDLCLLG